MGRISLPPEIVYSDKRPRTAVAFDKTSGVRQLPDTARRLLLVGQGLASGSIAANVPKDLLRETDSETYFGRGSVLDVAAKAAFKANPNIRLSAVRCADADGAVAAQATLTFATNASADGAYNLFVNGERVRAAITKNDTPTTIAAALAARINEAKDLPVTASAAAGVVTLTAKNAGTVGNDINLRGSFDANVATTATLSGSKMGSTVAGTGVASPALALAACGGQRYHEIAVLLDDSTSGTAARDYVIDKGDAEDGLGQMAHQAITSTLSAATTLSAALVHERSSICAIKGTDSWFVEVAAAYAAVVASEEVPNRPLNGLVLEGIKPPPVESRWIASEERALLENGVTPLNVNAQEKVYIVRAVGTRFKNENGDPDYSVFDIGTIRSFDYARDAITMMYSTRYGRARWADDPTEDDDFPSDVAYPSKVREDLINTAKDLQGEGIVQRVSELEDQFVVERDGTHCIFQVPADIIEGMHERLGKVVLIRRRIAS